MEDGDCMSKQDKPTKMWPSSPSYARVKTAAGFFM